jgi:hypothetical protein
MKRNHQTSNVRAVENDYEIINTPPCYFCIQIIGIGLVCKGKGVIRHVVIKAEEES